MKTKAIEPDDDTVMVAARTPLLQDLERGEWLALEHPMGGWWLFRGWSTPPVGRASTLADAVLFVAEGRLP